ncbi:MAG TPA: L-fucokinase [Candidatus Acidoferrum sp.]|nr:L-fucokinase [Candidatus Acidoferrum sp.]
MPNMTGTWDYLIVTAANDQQAKAYDAQIQQRREAGEIPQVRNCLVIPDMDGQRIGSGGSTLHSLACVLQRERPGAGPASFEEAEAILSGLRILIVHAGGDSRRLPAYSHCGKMFVPIPAKGQPSGASTLFDRLVPAFLKLPEGSRGQVVVASGDALILFNVSAVELARPGITALGSFASSKDAARHGVFCTAKDGSVRWYLQKPSLDIQRTAGAINANGKSVLDLGVMSFDASAAVQLLRVFFANTPQKHGEPALDWKTSVRAALDSHGIDLYREICCALGAETTFEQYADDVRAGGSTLDRPLLAEWFSPLRQIPLNLDILPRCKFFHFGTTRELITSGLALLAEGSCEPAPASLILNSDIQSEITADHAWIEGCSVRGTLTLEGFNAVVGVDVVKPLSLPKGVCLDISTGISRKGENVAFLRYYGIDDTFKHSAEEGGTFCSQLLQSWLGAMGAVVSEIWPPDVPARERTLWNARVFPALQEHQDFRSWLWLLNIESATPEQKKRFLAADRYSSSEIAVRVDQTQFQLRRSRIRSARMTHDDRRHSQAQTHVVEG